MNEEGDGPGLLLLLFAMAALAACAALGYRNGFAETGDVHLALRTAAIAVGISVGGAIVFAIIRGRSTRRFTISVLVIALVHIARDVTHWPESAAQRIASQAKEINNSAPKMIDKETRIDGATLGPGLTITVRSTLVAVDGKSVASSTWITRVAPKIRSKDLLDKRFRDLLSQGVVVVYMYSGRDGVPIGTLRLSKDDLGGNR